MPVNIKIQKGSKNFSLIGNSDVYSLKRKVQDTLEEIADAIREAASEFAPISDPADKAGGSASHIPSGALKENPVDIFESQFGESGAVGASGFRYRAPAGAVNLGGEKIGGQFLKGSPIDEGHIFYTIAIEYPEDPFYAKFVAFGTKGHGPRTAKIMKFTYKDSPYRAKYVRGQDPQPYLGRAVESVKGTVEMKMAELRAEARLIKSGG